MKTYPVINYTLKEWEDKADLDSETGNYEEMEDEIIIVWEDGVACLDIMANGKRIVPILRKIEKALSAVGLSGDSETAIFGGWFGSWADSLTDPVEREYFDWNYPGKYDAEQGNWSYSWGIEQIDDGRWYVFLNISTCSHHVDEHIKQAIKAKQQAKEDLEAVKTMECDEMESIHGNIAKIWYKPEDAEQSDSFPAMWEIWRDGEKPEKRTFHHTTYGNAIKTLEHCGYIW